MIRHLEDPRGYRIIILRVILVKHVVQMDGTDSGSCLLEDFVIDGVELPSSWQRIS
jgi:hypothetical protein